MLRKKGIPHNVLNAKYHELEAQIVSEAGRHGAVTIATNMAGRGTDISLMMRLLLQVVLRLLVQKDMKAVVLITSYVDVLEDREILVNQDSTFLLKMIL